MRARNVQSACRWTLGVLACVLVLRAHVPVRRHYSEHFAHLPPAQLALHLTDFSNHPNLYLHQIDEWEIVEEHSNYSVWEYEVRYRCGARCEGRGWVTHRQHPGEHHHDAQPSPHALSLKHIICTAQPLLLWMNLCHEMTMEATVESLGGGTKYTETVLANCGVWNWATGVCAAALDHRQQQVRRLAISLQIEHNHN